MLNQQKNKIVNQSGGIKFYEASPQFGKQSTEFKEQPHLIGEHFVRSEVLFADQDTCESIYDKYLANEQINQESQFQNVVNDPITQFNINDIMYPQTNEQQFRSIRQENFDDSLENIFSFEEVKTDSPQRILQPLQMFQQQELNVIHPRVQTYQPNQRVYEFDFGQLRVGQGNQEDTPNFRLIERRFPVPVVEQLRHNLQHERQLLHQERIQYQQERMDFQQQRMEFIPPNHIHHQRMHHDRPQIQQNHYEINRRIREISENRARDYQEFRQPTSFRSNPFQRYSPFDVRPQQHERRQLGGLDQNEVLMLTEINFIESKCRGWEEKDKKCSICLSEFQTNEKIRFLPCLHRFHSSCIDKWLKSNSKCPLCKKDIKILIKEMNGHHI